MNRLATISLFWLSLLTSLSAAQAAEPMDGCQVIARIGKQVVLSCEVMWKVNQLLEPHLETMPPEEVPKAREHLLKQNLDAMLDMKLLYADFRSKLPEANLPDIHKNLEEPFEKERIPALMKEIGVDKVSEIEPRMQELGATLEDVRQDFYQTTIARTWVREAIDIDDVVTHEQLLDYYKKNGAQYDYPAQAKWEELMVRFSRFPSENAAYAAIANMGNEAAVRRVAAEEPAFAEIAKTKSQGFTAKDGGAHPWTTKDALAAENINEALFSLQVGEMSPILKSPQGFHIVRVLERKTAGREPFSEVQSGIKNKIVGQRYNAALEKKLTELRRTTQIWTVFGGTMTAERFKERHRDGTLRR